MPIQKQDVFLKVALDQLIPPDGEITAIWNTEQSDKMVAIYYRHAPDISKLPAEVLEVVEVEPVPTRHGVSDHCVNARVIKQPVLVWMEKPHASTD